MVITGAEPTPAEAERFMDAWPARLERRLGWFVGQAGTDLTLDGSTASLDPAATWVLARLGIDDPVEDPPVWLTPGLAEQGWTAYGAALAEGLMAYVSQIYADHLGGAAPWVLDRDPKSAYYLKPIIDAPAIAPPWRQVLGSLRMAQETGRDVGLRSAVDHSLRHHDLMSDGGGEAAAPAEAEPWVVVTAAGRGEWQVSLAEDIAEQLGQAAYAELEDRLASVEGVREAIMEDRDRAIVRTGRGVDQTRLTARLEAAVASLANRD